MFKPDPLAYKAGEIFFAKAAPRLEALLKKYEVSDPSELSPALQRQLLQSTVLETAAVNFPETNLEMIKHQFWSSLQSAFLSAMDRMMVSCRGQSDAFEMTRGIYAAVVLAGFGLPVAPFDLQAARILAKPSNDIDPVQALFSADKGAYVGYSTCDAPFYLLLTDCVRSLRQLVPAHPSLSEVKHLFARTGRAVPSDFGQSFMPGMAVIARQPGDTISTVALLDPDPAGGSIMLYAGWQVAGEPFGAPNGGYLPIPGQLLRAVVNDPTVAFSFWPAAGAPTSIH